MALLAGGGYAELVAVPPPASSCPCPRGSTSSSAAAVPEVFLTAVLSLRRLAPLAAGETLLVHAAASGVGTAAIQVARELGGSSIGTVRRAEKADAVTGARRARDRHAATAPSPTRSARPPAGTAPT